MDLEAKDNRIKENGEMDVPSTSTILEDPLADRESKNSIKKEPELNLEVDAPEQSFLEVVLLNSESCHYIKEEPELDLGVDAAECSVDRRVTTEEATTAVTSPTVQPQPHWAVGNRRERRMATLDFTLTYLDILEQEEEDDTVILWLLNRSKKRRINSIYAGRNCDDSYNILINRHLLDDDTKFRHYFRLNVSQFSYVLQLIEMDIKKQSSSRVKIPISPAEKLAMTLRFLATGESYTCLAISFRISKGYFSRIVEEVLSALVNRLSPIYLPVPSTDKHLEQAKEFTTKWQFPNCVGAIGGKYITIKRCRANSGFLDCNDHEYFSTVFLAVVDTNCKFVMVDVGPYGKGDNGIFQKSELGNLLSRQTFYPAPTNLPDSDIVTPYVVIGDEAFDLTKHVMKPYSKSEACQDLEKRIFNYRLSRARRVSENSFSLLAQVFRVFQQPLAVKVATCHKLVTAACCLHNLLRDAYLERNGEPYYTQGRKLVQSAQNLVSFTPCVGVSQLEGIDVRDQFTSYFTNEGSVPWQRRFTGAKLSMSKNNT